MPDVSLLEPLCNELNISINELIKGEKTENDNIAPLSAETLTIYSKFLKRKAKRKLPFVLMITLVVLIPFITTAALSFNKTFFKSIYCSDFASNVTIPIPKFSYYRHTGGLDEYTTTLKTLKQPDDVTVFIEDYLRSLEKVEYDGKIYYYDQENDFTILTYRINNDGVGFVNTIYITYKEGKIGD